jgi:hypothetical protein
MRDTSEMMDREVYTDWTLGIVRVGSLMKVRRRYLGRRGSNGGRDGNEDGGVGSGSFRARPSPIVFICFKKKRGVVEAKTKARPPRTRVLGFSRSAADSADAGRVVGERRVTARLGERRDATVVVRRARLRARETVARRRALGAST